MGLFRSRRASAPDAVASFRDPADSLRGSGPAPSSADSAFRDPASPAWDPAVRPVSGSFRLEVQDVFSITGRGTVVTGQVASGTVTAGDQVRIAFAGRVLTCRVTAIEAFRKKLSSATAGDNVGLLLAEVSRDDVGRGAILTEATP